MPNYLPENRYRKSVSLSDTFQILPNTLWMSSLVALSVSLKAAQTIMMFHNKNSLKWSGTILKLVMASQYVTGTVTVREG